MRALLFLGLLGLGLLLPVTLLAGSIASEPLSNTNTQILSFQPEGIIQLERSFGDLEIQGWNRPEVEITTIRSLAPGDDPDEVSITTVKQGEDRLKITTQHSKTRAELKYVIRAPLTSKLVVHHEMGQVSVVNFTGDIEVTNRIGEIGLHLPEPENYLVDAKTHVGDVFSVVGNTKHQHVAGQQLRNAFVPARSNIHKQLFLRVGVGDITIRKLNW